MKYKTTKKAIKETYGKNIWCVGYCNLQCLLSRTEPFAYSARAEGWACDYYYIGDGICISTGYAPIGKHINYEICRKYDKMASEFLSREYDYEKQRDYLDVLIEKFIKEIESEV